MHGLPFDGIPVISDFTVELSAPGEDGSHVIFTSRAHGQLAHFPAWEHAERDLKHFTAVDVPFGTLDDPYDDRDDAWRILIFAHDGDVYVLEADSPGAALFPRYFRVSRELYLAAWAALIDEHNPALPA